MSDDLGRPKAYRALIVECEAINRELHALLAEPVASPDEVWRKLIRWADLMEQQREAAERLVACVEKWPSTGPTTTR